MKRCKCGCSQLIEDNKEFVRGHNSKASNPMLGKKHSEKTKKHLSLVHTGIKKEQWEKDKIAKTMKNKGYKGMPARVRYYKLTDKEYNILKRNHGIAIINAIAKGSYSKKTDTLPHRLLREAMQKEKIWKGFQNELPFRYACIDIANPKKKIAIFVDGDYWHGNYKVFKTLAKWQIKRRAIDIVHNKFLKKQGWIVLRFWEFDIKNNIQKCLMRIKKYA